MIGSRRSTSPVIFSTTKSPISSGSKHVRIASITAFLVLSFAAFFLIAARRPLLTSLSEDSASALFDDDGRYIMRNYDDIKPNSNFLAGLGGIWGVPMVCRS